MKTRLVGLSIPRLLLCPLAGLLLALPARLNADQHDSNHSDFSELDLEALMNIELDQVSTASRYAQRTTEAPSLVTVITSEEIRRFGYRTLADIYRNILGFYTTYDRNYEYTGVRGFGRPGDYDSRILVMLDGQRANDGVYDSPGTGNEFVLDTEIVDRIEIVRGPGSSLYGTNALFAVVNVITKRGKAFNAAEFEASAGRFDSYKGRATVGGELGDEGEFMLSVSGAHSRGDEELFFDSHSATNGGAAQNLDDEEYQRLYGNIRLGEFSLRAAYSVREKGLSNAPYGTLFNDPRAYTTDERALVSASWNHEISETTSLSAQVGYNWYQYEGQSPFEGSDPTSSIINRDFTRAERLDYQAQIVSRVSENHTLVGGIEYRDDFNLDQENFNREPRETFTFSHTSSETLGLFIQDHIQLGSGAALQIGLRYDDYSTVGGEYSPRAALVVPIAEKSFLKFLYGTAFRAPNSFERDYGDFVGNYLPNPELSSEKLESYEVVFEQTISKHARIQVSTFYYDIDDLISQVADVDAGQLQFLNTEGATAAGAEFKYSGRWDDGSLARVSYSFTETEDKESGKILSNSPRHLIKASLSVPVIAERAFISPEFHYVSARNTDFGNRVSDYATANLHLLYQTSLPGLSLKLSARNLFDKTYSEPVGGQFSQDSMPQDGRVFLLSATYRFGLHR